MPTCRIVVLNDLGCPTKIAHFEHIPTNGDIVSVPRVDGLSSAACRVVERVFHQRSIILLAEHDNTAEDRFFRMIDLFIRDNVSGDQL